MSESNALFDVRPQGIGRDRIEAGLVAALILLLLGQTALLGVTVAQIAGVHDAPHVKATRAPAG